tara:strand:+ start:10724 stop:11011 length:288 start_codon:yes stop_codon:yes gene_type:complete
MKFTKPEIFILIAIVLVVAGRYAIPVISKSFIESEPILCSSIIVPGGNGVAKKLCLNDDFTAPKKCHEQAVKSQDCGMLLYWESENIKNGFLSKG